MFVYTHIEATEGMEHVMRQMMEISERMQTLEELIKETNAHRHGLGDSKTESEVDGDSDESDSN